MADPESQPSPFLIPQPHGGALMPGVRKGEVRNPWGGPGKLGHRPITEALTRELEQGGAEAIASTLRAIAADKDHPLAVQAAKEILNRIEGPMAKKIDHTLETKVERRKVREVDYELKPEPGPEEPSGGA